MSRVSSKPLIIMSLVIQPKIEYDFFWQKRPMVAKIDNIWRYVEGYSYKDNSLGFNVAKVILNGKEYISTEFIFCDGYSEKDIEYLIIDQNMRTLPSIKKKVSVMGRNGKFYRFIVEEPAVIENEPALIPIPPDRI